MGKETTIRITKSMVLEYTARFKNKLEDVDTNTFIKETLSWILNKSETINNNKAATYSIEYALRTYSVPPLIFKEEPTLEKVFTLAEKYYLWLIENGKNDRDLSITAGSACNRVLQFIENETAEFETIDAIFDKINSFFKWMIK